jgi:hypothetical protein
MMSTIGYVVMVCLCCWHQYLAMLMVKMYHCREANILERSYSSVSLSLVSVCCMSWVTSGAVGDRQLELYAIFT